MAEGRVLRAWIWLISIPYVWLSILVDTLEIKSLEADLTRCINFVDQYCETTPKILIDALIFSEDHRSVLHPGIDVIAMARALYMFLRFGKVQGASTIEQQCVRVITNRFERTFRRKIREQILAMMLVRRRSKDQIASTYLSVAFYGTGSIGLVAINAHFKGDLGNVSFHQAIRFLVQLKYPRPRTPSKDWYSKVETRISTLLKRAESFDFASRKSTSSGMM